MRLSDVLSKPVDMKFWQVDSFLNKKLSYGKSRKITVGKIGLPYYCKHCDDNITFLSSDELYCIGVNNSQISIDCALRCPRCGHEIAVWFLVDCSGDIYGVAPEVRVLKRTEKFNADVQSTKGPYGNFSELLEKAEIAYNHELGAGAIIYLRKIYEDITVQTAAKAGISILNSKSKRKPFSDILKEVDAAKSIIPKEFSAKGYKLFSELSSFAHGNKVSDADALKQYKPFRRLVVGILENVKNSDELATIIGSLGW